MTRLGHQETSLVAVGSGTGCRLLTPQFSRRPLRSKVEAGYRDQFSGRAVGPLHSKTRALAGPARVLRGAGREITRIRAELGVKRSFSG